MKTCLIVCILLCCLFASPGLAQAGTEDGEINMTKLAKTLGVFFVLSVIFEIALTPIFDWTVFLLYCEGKGCKTPIKVALALLVSMTYPLNILTEILEALGKGTPSERSAAIAGQILTALLIAGGSDGIYKIFTRLGLRNPLEREQKAKEFRQAKAEQNKSADEGSDSDADSGSGEESAPERPQGEGTPNTT